MNTSPEAPLSPAAAAKRVGCSRTTIVRALDSKELIGIRDNRNHRKITPEELDNWAKSKSFGGVHGVYMDTDHGVYMDTDHGHLIDPQQTVVRTFDNSDLAAQLKAMKATLDDMTAELNQARVDQARLEERAQGLEARLGDAQSEIARTAESHQAQLQGKDAQILRLEARLDDALARKSSILSRLFR